MFLANGSYMPEQNKVEIIKMNETHGMRNVLTIEEPYPPTKLMWIPTSALGVQSRSRDILATSSDILRIYDLKKDETNPRGHFNKPTPIKLRND